MKFLILAALLALSATVFYGQHTGYQIYPYIYDTLPGIDSPGLLHDTIETIVVVTREEKFGIVPVTVENGNPLMYSYRLGTCLGKDNQLQSSADFPELARSGLHDEVSLDQKEMITGIPLHVINCTARPEAYSHEGFIAADEDVISVLKGDNKLVQSLVLTHPQLARPLFHVWNLILMETELGNWSRHYDNVTAFYYNGHRIDFKASGSKGWQISVFFDEVQGRYNIHTERTMTQAEEQFLSERYNMLEPETMDLLITKLTRLDFSEMLPYYILKYGFYEGHTAYRCDPVAVAFIFGLKSLEELEKALPGQLYQAMTKHYSAN